MAAIGAIGGIASVLQAQATNAANPATATGAAGGVGSIGGPGGVSGGTTGTSNAGGSFLDSLGDALGQLNTQLTSADASMASFASGGSADLHTVMLELQQASIGLKTGIAVRDKLLEAYQDLMRLQI